MTRLGHTDVGLYIKDGKAVMIDTGSEEVPELISWFADKGITPEAIINTHLHIDHIGCNKLLCEHYACRVFASEDEISHENDADYTDASGVCVNPDDGEVEVPCGSFGIVSMRGHSEGHQAVITPDGVCFLGDVIMSAEKLHNTRMPYHYDLSASLESMDKLQRLALDHPDYIYVLSHFGVYDGPQIAELARENKSRELQLLDEAKAVIAGLPAGAAANMKDEKMAALFMDRIGVSREKQDIYWVQETALARIRLVR